MSIPKVWSTFMDIASLVATPLRPSHYLELVNPLWATHKIEARVESVWDETRDARTLRLRPGRNWRRHRAGQHVLVGVRIEGVLHTRAFSLSSSPDRPDGCIEITVKAVPGGRVSGHLTRDLRTGTFVSLSLPQGDFLLPEARPVKPLFVTAGSGITPVMSILRTAAIRETLRDVAHVHYAPHERAVIFGGELRALAEGNEGYRLREVITSPQAHTRFSSAQLDLLCPDWREREVWVCGPQRLLDAVETCLREAGRGKHLHAERFQAPRAVLPASTAGGRVRFARSGREVDADGRLPLLRVAEDAGLSLPHGCRIGICHSCNVTMVSGTVRDLRNGQIVAEAGACVQPCVYAAAGDVELAS